MSKKPLEVQSCKQKKDKRFPHTRGIFANSMQNRQLVCLKKTPINNRDSSIPAPGLRAQGKEKKPKCLLAFQDIWHSCDYIFLQSIKENKLTQY